MNKFYFIDNSYVDFLRKLNLEPEKVFEEIGVSYHQGKEDGVYVDVEGYVHFMELLDRYIDDKTMIHCTDIKKVMMFMPPLFAAMCAKDGVSCFRTISKYKKLIGPFILDINLEGDMFTLEFIFDNNDRMIPRFTALSEQVLMVNILRSATGLDIKPSKIASPYEYGFCFNEFFGIEPEESSRSIIQFRLEDVKKPFLTQNNRMWEYLEPELKKRIQEIEKDETLSAKVRSLLFELIPVGEGKIENVARELIVSVRTLQRKLSDEGTTFLKQLNHTRELLARNYLKDDNISNDEVAFLLGYSDGNAFRRGFRSWTGMTPKEYRDKIKDS